MIELRTLHYFSVACRSANLTLAAQSLGIALSTLSQTLKSLDTFFGRPLFQRVDGGLYPTGFARTVLRTADALLLAERTGRRWLRETKPSDLRTVSVDVQLSFTIGGVSQAILAAAEALSQAHADVLIDTIWSDGRDAGHETGVAAEEEREPTGRVLITLEADRSGSARPTLLLKDDWIFARRYPAGTTNHPSAADIARGRIIVPLLAPALVEQAHRHLRKLDIRNVRFVHEHPGDLPKIMHENSDAAVFVPRSLISPRLGLSQVATITPKIPLLSRIVAYETAASPMTGAFLRALKRAIAAPQTPPAETPVFTRREAQYFVATERLRRISAAAKFLRMSQPALSEHLQKLEAVVGERLFDRLGGGVVPTQAGQRFTTIARLIETGFARLSDDHTSASLAMTGRVSVGVLPSVHQHGYLVNRVADALVDVQMRRPGLMLAVQEAPNTVLQELVMRGSVGLAIVETTLPHIPRLPLGSSEGLAAVVHVRHDLLPPGPVRLEDLLRRQLAVPTHRFGLRHLLDEAAAARGLKFQPLLEIDALPMVVALLTRLPVCAVLPPSAVEREIANGELSVHRIVEPAIQRKLFVIYSAERTLTEAERDLVQTLRRTLGDRPDA